jgi:PKD repeat protein
MKKQLLTIFGLTTFVFGSFAQHDSQKLMPCGTFDAMEEAFKVNPALKKQYEANQIQFETAYQQALIAKKSNLKTTATIYTVPIVFHIMGAQNITDQVIMNFVSGVNRDYAKLGTDTGSINASFKNLYVDAQIQFALAQKDPLGNCTNGIIRHNSDSPYWNQTSPNYAYTGTGTNRWPPNKYLNVYIVDCIASSTYTCPVTTGAYLGGYTYLPGSTPYTTNGNMGDAIVYLKSLLGQSNPNDSRTLSHEIGHWFNLSHTFGSTNNPYFDPSNPPTTAATCGNDNVADTPPTGGYFSYCPTTYSLDCTTLPNIENIMDYASCPRMFTQGQVTRMRTAITSATAGRNNLWTAANLLATGITTGYTCTPIADFTANKLAVCAGNTFTYTNLSQVGTSGGLSWAFQGGNPATSTSTSQVVSYATPGTYSVSLTATNTSGSNTMNKTSYVNVINGAGGATVPVISDFEGATLPSSITVQNGNVGSVTWAQNTATGGNSTLKSIYINNASATSTGGNLDIFQTSVYNFSNTSGITLSYYYAYAKRLATQADTFKIQYSLDCGGSWSNVLGIPTTAVMAAASGGTTTTAFVPTPAQWVLKTISSALLAPLNNKPSVMFRCYFRSDAVVGRSNNIYIDQINLTGTINTVTGITELEKSIDLIIYPNPTHSSSTLDFNILTNQKAKISIVDIMGRVFEENTVISDNYGHVNHTINPNGTLASGVYIVNIEVNNQRISKKIIID